MMGSRRREDQKRLSSLMKSTVVLLSKEGLNYERNIKIQGVFGITVDDDDVFIIHMNETIDHPDTIPDESRTSTKRSHSGRKRSAKRRRRRRSYSSDSESDSNDNRDARTTDDRIPAQSDTVQLQNTEPSPYRKVVHSSLAICESTNTPLPQPTQNENIIEINPEVQIKQETFDTNYIEHDEGLHFAISTVDSQKSREVKHQSPLGSVLQTAITTESSRPFITGLVENKASHGGEIPSSTQSVSTLSVGEPVPGTSFSAYTSPNLRPRKRERLHDGDNEMNEGEPGEEQSMSDSADEQSLERFPIIRTEDLEHFFANKDSEKTKATIQCAVNTFTAWLDARKLKLDAVEQGSLESIDSTLKQFYAEARRGDGEYYSLRSLATIRYGLQRHFQTKRNVDIIKDHDFRSSHETYVAIKTKLKQEGHWCIKHKVPVTIKDWQKLHDSGLLDSDKPETLQNKVFLDVMLFIRKGRGRGDLRSLNKNDFKISTDYRGQRLVHYVEGNIEDQNTPAMCADGTKTCPVTSFEKYICKLNPNSGALFQKPIPIPKLLRTGALEQLPVWYEAIAIGKNTLGVKMKELSAMASLDKTYTNMSLKLAGAARNWTDIFQGLVKPKPQLRPQYAYQFVQIPVPIVPKPPL